MTRSFNIFFDLRLNERLSKQSWGWWLETPSHLLWRHRNGIRRHRSLKLDRATKNETRLKICWTGETNSNLERPVPCTYGTQISLWLHAVANGTRPSADTLKTKISRINFQTASHVHVPDTSITLFPMPNNARPSAHTVMSKTKDYCATYSL